MLVAFVIMHTASVGYFLYVFYVYLCNGCKHRIRPKCMSTFLRITNGEENVDDKIMEKY
jgi:hypothetical protein